MPSAFLRVWLIYLWQHRRPLRLRRATRFTELVQARKLFERDPRLPTLIDKVRVKPHVARVLGEDWVIPTPWFGDALPEHPPAPLPLVVKARHGCGQIAFVHTQDDWTAARKRAANWVRQRYGRWLDEWAYGEIPRGVLVEPLIGALESLPVDYKFFVFGGRVEYIQVHLDRAGAHRWVVFDREWRALADDTAIVPPPESLSQMIEGAEALGRDHDFVRVDLYEVDARPLFGELTFYPGSGVLPIEPAWLDDTMGQAWRAAATAGGGR